MILIFSLIIHKYCKTCMKFNRRTIGRKFQILSRNLSKRYRLPVTMTNKITLTELFAKKKKPSSSAYHCVRSQAFSKINQTGITVYNMLSSFTNAASETKVKTIPALNS